MANRILVVDDEVELALMLGDDYELYTTEGIGPRGDHPGRS